MTLNEASEAGDKDDQDQYTLLPLMLPDDPSTGRPSRFLSPSTCSSSDNDDVANFSKTGLRAGLSFHNYPVERRKTLLAFALMFFSAGLNGAVAALITDLVPRTPMPDVLFQLVPEQPWAWQLSDTITMMLSFTHVCFVLVHKHRWVVARRFCVIAAQLYLLRGVCMGVTWMAVPGQYHASRCVPRAPLDEYWPTVAARVSRFMLSLGLSAGGSDEGGGSLTAERRILCGDLLFSGHTLMLTLTWLSIDAHAPRRACRPLRLAVGAATALGIAAIVACRMHYTVDVVLAFVLTALHFAAYYAHVAAGGRHDRLWRRYVRLAFWTLPLVDYFEANLPRAKAPRTLEWPMERPTVAVRFFKQLNG